MSAIKVFYKPAQLHATNQSETKHSQTVNDYKNSDRRKLPPGSALTIDVILIGPYHFCVPLPTLTAFITNFFRAKVNTLPPLYIDTHESKGNAFISPDQVNGHLIDIKQYRTTQALDVLSLLKLLLSTYKSKSSHSIIAFIDFCLFEKKDFQIMGRACGNGACAISLKRCTVGNDKHQNCYEMLKTISHELSHTMGIGHCNEFSCIMNPFYVKQRYTANVVEYCPICLEKFGIFSPIDHMKRWADLRNYYKRIGFVYGFRWMRDRMEQMAK